MFLYSWLLVVAEIVFFYKVNCKTLGGSRDYDELIAQAKRVAPISSDLESFALKQASNSTAHREYDIQKSSILCAVFLKVDTKNVENLQQNMIYTENVCDWIIIAYSGDKSLLRSIKKNNSRVVHISFGIGRKHQKFSEQSFEYTYITSPSAVNLSTTGDAPIRSAKDGILNDTSVETFVHIPKPILYFQLVPYLSLYHRVWLLDEDMSFEGFNFHMFFRILDCGFYPRPPPLIAQALVAENTQFFPYLNAKSWKGSPVLAVPTGYVEQQAPIIHAGFLEWYINNVITPMAPAVEILGSDWSFDDTWCLASKAYSRLALDYNDDAESCALIIQGTPIHHLNTRSLKFMHLRKNEFGYLGNALRNLTASAFPSWFRHGYKSNPLHVKDRSTTKRASWTISNQCNSTSLLK